MTIPGVSLRSPGNWLIAKGGARHWYIRPPQRLYAIPVYGYSTFEAARSAFAAGWTEEE